MSSLSWLYPLCPLPHNPPLAPNLPVSLLAQRHHAGSQTQHLALSGCLDLIYTGLGGRVEGLQMMTKVENGSHMSMSLVHCRKVAALILDPVSTGACVPVFPRLPLPMLCCLSRPVTNEAYMMLLVMTSDQ